MQTSRTSSRNLIHKSTQRVGDVEVSTAIVVETPACDKLLSVTARSQPIGEFLDWLTHERGITLCEIGAHERFHPAATSIQRLLAEYFAIDEDACERERCALLEAIRR